jgi:hypothetical protein
MLVKEKNIRSNSTELKNMLENLEKITDNAKITYKVKLFFLIFLVII